MPPTGSLLEDDLFDLIKEVSKVLAQRGDEDRAYAVMTVVTEVMDKKDFKRARKICLNEIYR